MNRLKDKTFARSGIPEKQEPAVMRLVVSNVPYEPDDRRRPPHKRAGSKPRSQTEERNTVTPTPEIHHHHHHPQQPAMNMMIQPPLPPSAQLPLQPPIPQHIVAQQQTPPIQQHQPAPAMMNTSVGRSIIRPFMNGQPPPPPGIVNIIGAISTNSAHPAFPTPDFVPMHAPPPSSSSLHEMVSNGASNEPTAMMMMNGQQPPLQMGEDSTNASTSSAFFDIFNVDTRDCECLFLFLCDKQIIYVHS